MLVSSFADMLVTICTYSDLNLSHTFGILQRFCAEIRAASEDASEVKKTKRKWLTIMNKDCNCFCKILVCIYLLPCLLFYISFLSFSGI
jgi:hypothetical protein